MRVIRALKWALFLTCLGWAGYSAYGVFVFSQLSRALDRASPIVVRPEASGLPNLYAGLQLLAVIAGPALVSGVILLIKFPSKERLTYAAVDQTITAWAGERELEVITEVAGKPRRFCYVSGGTQECYQISVEPPAGGYIRVNVWDVDTIDDSELHASWMVPVEELSLTLDLALGAIRTWDMRPKGRARWKPWSA